jgi:hypothetical protein
VRYCRGLLGVLALIVLAVPALGQDKATLKWKFQANTSFYQKMTTETKQTMKVMGSEVTQNQKQTFYFKWTPIKQDGDNWEIQQEIEGVQMDIDIGGTPIKYDSLKQETGTTSPLGEFFKALIGSKFTLTVDKNLNVTKIQGRDEFLSKLVKANPQMEPLLKAILSDEALKQMADPTFAAIQQDKEVSKGNTWTKDTKLNMGPIGTYENNYKYTYDGQDDKKLDKILVETTLKYTPPAADQAGGLPFKIKSADLTSKNAKGTILFNNEKGRIQSSNMTLDLDGKLSIEIGGQTTPVELKQNQTTSVETTDESQVKKT